MENHHVQWVNQLVLWLFSIALCMFTRPGTIHQYQVPTPQMYRIQRHFHFSKTSGIARCSEAACQIFSPAVWKGERWHLDLVSEQKSRKSPEEKKTIDSRPFKMKLDHLSRNTRIWRCLEWVYRCLQSQFTYFRYHSHSASRHLTGAFRSGNSLTSQWIEVGWIPLNTYSYRTVQKSLFISIWFHCWMLNPPEIWDDMPPAAMSDITILQWWTEQIHWSTRNSPFESRQGAVLSPRRRIARV
jgi:hypothetical protein